MHVRSGAAALQVLVHACIAALACAGAADGHAQDRVPAADAVPAGNPPLGMVWRIADRLPTQRMPVARDGGGLSITDAQVRPDTVVEKTFPLRMDRRIDSALGPDTMTRWVERTDAAASGVPVPESELRSLFNELFRQAVERSPKLAQVRSALEAAKHDVDEAKGRRWPQVDVGTQSATLAAGDRPPTSAPNRGAVSLTVTTPLYDWGQIDATIESREQLVQAARFNYEAEAMNVAYELVRNSAEMVKNRFTVAASEQFVSRMGALVRMLHEIVAVDRGRASELTQAKARLLQAEAARDAAQARVVQFELALKKLLGTATLPPVLDQRWQLSVADLGRLLDELPDHPTVRKADAEINSAERQADALHASGLPKLNWTVSQSTAVDVYGYKQPLQTGLSISWPLSRGGSQDAAEAAARQRAQSGRDEKAQTALDLEFNVRTAERDAKAALERADAYDDLSVETNRVRLDFFEQWYHLGRRSLLDVLTAEGDHYGNVTNGITSRFDGYLAIFREYKEAGALVRWLDPL